ncbi:hypothetical protein N0B16_08665 [Chryseobacterium sp. GMJ5]|uniref:Lipoprotein n=1 Tax=Chryseobacterium gilvum TaxID=2976534 RepID=A0ABT2VZN0_9FLAO|nr:hypothetical protein [Chryseobacterium gilvum]MCU7614509.1 hypothetical protein [Chryseobacterium gilvum]
MKSKNILFATLIFFCAISCTNRIAFNNIDNFCGQDSIRIFYTRKKNAIKYRDFSFVFRSGIKDTIQVTYEDQIVRKFVDNELQDDHNLQFFTFKINKDSLVRVSIGNENYCFKINNTFYYYDFIKRKGILEVYADGLRNRNFE